MVMEISIDKRKCFSLALSITFHNIKVAFYCVHFFSKTKLHIIHQRTDRKAYQNYLHITKSESRHFKILPVTSNQTTLLLSTLNDAGPRYDEIQMFAYK